MTPFRRFKSCPRNQFYKAVWDIIPHSGTAGSNPASATNLLLRQNVLAYFVTRAINIVSNLTEFFPNTQLCRLTKEINQPGQMFVFLLVAVEDLLRPRTHRRHGKQLRAD